MFLLVYLSVTQMRKHQRLFVFAKVIVMDMRLPGGASEKEPTCKCRRHERNRFYPRVGKIPWRRAWLPTPVFLPGQSYGQKSLAATVHRVTKSRTQLKQLSMHSCLLMGKKSRMFVNSTMRVMHLYCFNNLQGIKGLIAVKNEPTCPKDSCSLQNLFSSVCALPRLSLPILP